MTSSLRVALAGLSLLGSLAARADVPPDAPPTPAPAEPAVQHTVIEDDNVRIEELRVRGQTQSITVKSKIPGVATYQIVPGSGARDPSAPGDTAGQRLWHFFSF
jgi:hypothetical protein